MKSLLRVSFVAVVNVVVFVALLGGIELFFRTLPQPEQPFPEHNGLWQKLLPYVRERVRSR